MLNIETHYTVKYLDLIFIVVTKNVCYPNYYHANTLAFIFKI